MNWLRILGTPTRHFVRDTSAPVAPGQARHALLASLGPLRSAAGGENANLTALLANEGGQASALLADPPLGAQAEIVEDGAVIFAGSVRRVTLAADGVSVEVQA